jgi:hypothetical protein
MRPIEINLATRPFRNNSLYWAGFGTAVLALAAVTAVNAGLFLGYGSTMRQHREDLTTKQQRREALARDERRLSLKLTKLDFKGLATQAEFANDAIRRRTFSWTGLFNRLEEVVPPAVMMIAIRPEIQAEGISIVAEGSAKDQEGLLQFEENLIRNPRFARIYPGSERREQRGQDLRFSLKFDYVPGDRPSLATPATGVAKGPEKPVPEEKPAAQPAVKGTGTAPSAGETAARAAAVPPPAASPSAAAVAPRPVTAPPALPQTAPARPVPAVASQKAAPPAALPPSQNPQAGREAASPVRPASPSLQQARPGGGGPRPLAKPGGIGRTGPRPGAPTPFGPAARRKAEEEAAARFSNQALQDVFDYLMKYRSMTFVFAGDFDLLQKVTLDLNGVEEEEILRILVEKLNCVVAREGPHAYRLSPKSGGEPLEEPPVQEEPPPDDGSDSPAQDPGQDPGQGTP